MNDESKPTPPVPADEPGSQPGPATDTPDTSHPETEPETGPVTESRRGGGLAPLVLSLLALGLSIGLAATAYFSWHQLQRVSAGLDGIETRLDQRLQPLRDSLGEVNRALQEQRHQLDSRLQSLRGEMQSLAESQTAVERRVGVLAALVGRSEQGWTLAEVEYLLRIANQRLQLQRDSTTARVALQAADARLRDLADPHFLVVREQIAHELDALAQVPAVDRDGIAARLVALAARIDSLPVAGSDYRPAQPAQAGDGSGPETHSVPDWRELPSLLWSVISDLFRIREHEQNVKPMLPPEREYFLRENLRLQLAAARLALLRDDAAQYLQSLKTAAGWLDDYFARDPQVTGMQAQLGELAAIDVTPALPDVSAPLRLLRQQLKLLGDETTASAPAPAVDTPADDGAAQDDAP